MRDNPPATTTDADSLRPLFGVALLLVVVVVGGAVVVLTDGGPTVEITATPDPDAGPNVPAAYEADDFESPSPLVQAVERADREGGRVQTTTTVENLYAVRLASDDQRRTYHVELADAESGTRFYEVTVEVQR
jgi:hypothetical protein